jgi:hypothetical protein
MTAQPIPGPRGTAAVLDSVREMTATARDIEIDIVEQIVAWAELNTATDRAGAATITDGRLDTGVPIAGEGAPLVSEFALMELCAVLGRSTASGREYVGKVLETAHRLPELWAELIEGRVPVWRCLAIADRTRLLSADAAAYVDHHIAKFAAGCTWAQVDRLAEEALVRFDPETAEERRQDAAERRHFDIDTQQVSFDGTARIEGELDLADALDLEAAVRRRAIALGELGCEDSLNVRRSIAAGEMARADQMLDLETSPGRKVELHVHLTDQVLHGAEPVARLDNTQSPISPEQIKDWCRTPGTTVIVRPVIDLAGHEPLGAYEIPNRHRRQVTLRDPHCRFPHCNRRAASCDLDHAIPHTLGGPTCPCNLVPLCRSHHRAKTHAAWGYTVLDAGSYLWTSPHGHQYLVDHRGTRTLDRDP